MSAAHARGRRLADSHAGGAAALSACATSPYKRAGNAGEIAAALARSQPPPSAARSLVFLVLGGSAGARVAAYDLATSRLVWTQPGEVTTRIAVGADVIVHGSKPVARPARRSDGQVVIVARDIGNGAVLWQSALAADERLAGYDIDARRGLPGGPEGGRDQARDRRQRRRAGPARGDGALAAPAADRAAWRDRRCGAAWSPSRSTPNT